MKRYDHALTPTAGNNWRSLMDERDNGDYVLYKEAAAIIAEHISTNKMLTAEGDSHRKIIVERDKKIDDLRESLKECQEAYTGWKREWAISHEQLRSSNEALVAAQARIIQLKGAIPAYSALWNIRDDLAALEAHDMDAMAKFMEKVDSTPSLALSERQRAQLRRMADGETL